LLKTAAQTRSPGFGTLTAAQGVPKPLLYKMVGADFSALR
jgi:hypothetical protein